MCAIKGLGFSLNLELYVQNLGCCVECSDSQSLKVTSMVLSSLIEATTKGHLWLWPDA